MAFLPGLVKAIDQTYTVLDDIRDSAERGHDIVTLFNDLVQLIGVMFHHSNVHSNQVDALAVFAPHSSEPLVMPLLPPSMVPVPWKAATRDEKIQRDLDLKI